MTETSAPDPRDNPAAADGDEAAAQEKPHHEPHDPNAAGRLNWLRAAVLGANDGVTSVAGLVVGVAGARPSTHTLVLTGIAGLVAGALSMGAGEYVSVSTQRDGEKALLDKEKWELENLQDDELEELTELYERKGLSRELAEEVAGQLTQHDALAAHAEVELGIDPDELTNPWHAAWASMASFTVGALLPVLTILLPQPYNIPITFGAVLVMLAITGGVSARLSGAIVQRAILRNMAGGAFAMGVTYLIGHLMGGNVA